MEPRRSPDRAHHLPLLRRRLRRAGDAARRTAGSRSPAIRTIRPISDGCAPRARRSARRCDLEGRLLLPEIAGARARAGTRRSISSRTGLPTPSPNTGRTRRLLRLRPVADRGLLRRQQADEGLHRLGQYRHQFAAVHGVFGRRPSPRLRLRHGARHLRRSGTCRSRGARWLQSRLVPSGALPAHRRGQGRAAGDEASC